MGEEVIDSGTITRSVKCRMELCKIHLPLFFGCAREHTQKSVFVKGESLSLLPPPPKKKKKKNFSFSRDATALAKKKPRNF